MSSSSQLQIYRYIRQCEDAEKKQSFRDKLEREFCLVSSPKMLFGYISIDEKTMKLEESDLKILRDNQKQFEEDLFLIAFDWTFADTLPGVEASVDVGSEFWNYDLELLDYETLSLRSTTVAARVIDALKPVRILHWRNVNDLLTAKRIAIDSQMNAVVCQTRDIDMSFYESDCESCSDDQSFWNECVLAITLNDHFVERERERSVLIVSDSGRRPESISQFSSSTIEFTKKSSFTTRRTSWRRVILHNFQKNEAGTACISLSLFK